jgi:hypothetical protein
MIVVDATEQLHITMFETKKQHQQALEDLSQKLQTLKRTVQLQQQEMLQTDTVCRFSL